MLERAAGRVAIQVDAVRDRVHAQAERDQDEAAARAPAGERDRADHEADQEQVAERVGDVGGHGLDVALRCVRSIARVQDRGADRRDRQRADRSVEPQARVEARHARPHEQHDPGVGRRGTASGGRRPRATGTRSPPGGTGGRPSRRRRPSRPRCRVPIRIHAARSPRATMPRAKHIRRACRQHERVEPVVEEARAPRLRRRRRPCARRGRSSAASAVKSSRRTARGMGLFKPASTIPWASASIDLAREPRLNEIAAPSKRRIRVLL